MIVPDYQLSLAIGKEGQNARLAARLTNYKIDIKSESQARELGYFEELGLEDGDYDGYNETYDGDEYETDEYDEEDDESEEYASEEYEKAGSDEAAEEYETYEETDAYDDADEDEA